MDVLTVNQLTKTFRTKSKSFSAVSGVSFSLGKGEILGLLGPNGAGKTTTIQMLLGVLTPTSGSITYFGKNFSAHREEILEKVNFSSTYTNLPWNLTVHEVLTYSSYLYDLPDRSARVKKLAEIFRLDKIASQPLSELSAGQLTRVNLAKSFVNEPEVLLLDEPTASLDPEVAKLVRDFILEERRKKNLSVIFTSHNMPEVEEVCDRILFINNGMIVANDTPENLMKTLDTVHVRFVMRTACDTEMTNIVEKLSGKLHQSDREYTITCKEPQIPALLQEVSAQGLSYMEISIDKPTLEDYFLHVAKENKNRDV